MSTPVDQELDALIDRLAAHRTLAAAPRHELEWLAAHGTLRRYEAGEILSVKGMQVEWLYVILSGHLALLVDRGAGLNKVFEWGAGDVSGMLPFSRLTAAPGNSTALEAVELLAIPRGLMREMTRDCFEVTSILVHSMLDRSRIFTTGDLHNEKMISLGKLSAGLAHELNNPASAIERCVATLDRRIQQAEANARVLAVATLSEAQVAAIDRVRAACEAKADHAPRSPLELSDREEALADWLSGHGIDCSSADMLADSEVSFEALDQLAVVFEPQVEQQTVFAAAVQWVAANCAIRNLGAKIQDSAMSISSLVTAVKGFTHMDQANVAEAVDLCENLGNTVAVLRSKAREKAVTVSLEIEPDLPRVRGFAMELNQVWGNLIDNALDAVGHGGKVEVVATYELQRVVVRVIDDGAGVADEIRDRVFDPFFTTKPQGQGIGLGLDIVRRLVRHNEGAVDVDSRPGHTEFRVILPVAVEV